MAADFHFPPAVVLIQETGALAVGSTGVLRTVAGGPTASVYDLNGSPLAGVTVGPLGVHPGFRADISDGVLDFGSVLLPTVSIEAQSAAINAQESAQAAQAAAEYAASVSVGKADASHSHSLGDLTASGSRTSDTFLRGDGTWAVPPSALGGGNVVGDGVLNIRKLTQSQYDALATKDPATLYVRMAG